MGVLDEKIQGFERLAERRDKISARYGGLAFWGRDKPNPGHQGINDVGKLTAKVEEFHQGRTAFQSGLARVTLAACADRLASFLCDIQPGFYSLKRFNAGLCLFAQRIHGASKFRTNQENFRELPAGHGAMRSRDPTGTRALRVRNAGCVFVVARQVFIEPGHLLRMRCATRHHRYPPLSMLLQYQVLFVAAIEPGEVLKGLFDRSCSLLRLGQRVCTTGGPDISIGHEGLLSMDSFSKSANSPMIFEGNSRSRDKVEWSMAIRSLKRDNHSIFHLWRQMFERQDGPLAQRKEDAMRWFWLWESGVEREQKL